MQGLGHIASAVTGDQSYANTADKYGAALQHPVTLGGIVDQVAPTTGGTAGAVARFGGQLLGGATPLAGVNAVNDAASAAAGVQKLPVTANMFTPPKPTIAGRVVNAFSSNKNTGAQLVAQKLAQDNVMPGEAAQQITQANANGQPLMPADMGDNTRALAADVARQPGAARTIGLNAVRDRQIGDNPFGSNTVPSQSERVQAAISRDLGPVADPIAASQALSEQAKAAAGPLYDRAYSAPGASVLDVGDLMQRPSMQKALKNAVSIAREEGRDPNALGIKFDAEGNPTEFTNPSWQTFDYIKRGLDDVIEGYRDPTTGKLNLDTQGRAVNNTLRDFIGRVDQANPDYAAARAAYSGPASMKEALNAGTDALNWAPNQIRARMASMGDAEKAQFWLGMRSALAQKAAATNDGTNVVRGLVGSGLKRDALAEAAGGQANLENFMRSLEREQQMNTTYAKVTGGSSTAGNLQERQSNAAALGDSAIGHFGNGGGIREFILNHGIRQAQGALRYGVGQAGQRAREDAAALLFTSKPNDFTQAINQANASTVAANRTGANALAVAGRGAAQIGVNSVRQPTTLGIQASTQSR